MLLLEEMLKTSLLIQQMLKCHPQVHKKFTNTDSHLINNEQLAECWILIFLSVSARTHIACINLIYLQCWVLILHFVLLSSTCCKEN